MFFTILFIHITLCVVLISLVLMQQGKGADMGAAFGGGSSSLFGAGGATDFVTKLTTSLAIAFMVTSILLVRAYTSYSADAGVVTANPLEGSVIKEQAPAAAPAPVAEVPASEVKPAEVTAPLEKQASDKPVDAAPAAAVVEAPVAKAEKPAVAAPADKKNAKKEAKKKK